MWRYLKNVSPEPQPNRITNDEDNYKSSIVKVKPGLLLIANKKMRIYSWPRHIAKPPVVRSCFLSVGLCRYEWQGVSRVWASKLFCKVGFVSGFVCLANVLAFAWAIFLR
jgi:hypothetical protein